MLQYFLYDLYGRVVDEKDNHRGAEGFRATFAIVAMLFGLTDNGGGGGGGGGGGLVAALTAQPDAVDLQACAGVTALTDASACEAKVANNNAAADPKACTYTAADPSTGAAATCVDKVSAARKTCPGRLGVVKHH